MDKNSEFKELKAKLYKDGNCETMANMPLTVDESLRLLVELELLCCNHLDINPMLFHTGLQNILMNVMFPIDENLDEEKVSNQNQENNLN